MSCCLSTRLFYASIGTRNRRKKIFLSANASLILETLTVLVVRDASMSLPTPNVLLDTAPVVSIARIRYFNFLLLRFDVILESLWYRRFALKLGDVLRSSCSN